MDYNELSDEQKAKAKACKTPEDILALAREEGVELTDDQLESVSGGWGGSSPGCEKPYYECPSFEGNPR